MSSGIKAITHVDLQQAIARLKPIPKRSLPVDMWHKVFEFADARTCAQISLVCKEWRQINHQREELDFTGIKLTDLQLQRMVDRFPQLKVVQFEQEQRITPEGFQSLTKLPLERLTLPHAPHAALFFPRLKYIAFTKTPFVGANIDYVKDLPVHVMEFWNLGRPLPSTTVEQLQKLPLEQLELVVDELTDEQLVTILNGKALNVLSLNSCGKITNAALKSFPRTLESLDLSGTKVDSAGLEHLNLPSLRSLILEGSTISSLEHMQNFRGLIHLNLNRAVISDEDLIFLENFIA